MWPKYDNKSFFFHSRESIKNNGSTVCFVPIGVGEPYFRMGVSVCSLCDNFCKKKGRLIAEGRAIKKGYRIKANSFEELKVFAKEFFETF